MAADRFAMMQGIETARLGVLDVRSCTRHPYSACAAILPARRPCLRVMRWFFVAQAL